MKDASEEFSPLTASVVGGVLYVAVSIAVAYMYGMLAGLDILGSIFAFLGAIPLIIFSTHLLTCRNNSTSPGYGVHAYRTFWILMVALSMPILGNVASILLRSAGEESLAATVFEYRIVSAVGFFLAGTFALVYDAMLGHHAPGKKHDQPDIPN